MSQKNYLDLAGLTAYDIMIKQWSKASIVDITDDAINALFVNPLEVPYVTFTAEEDNSSIGLLKKWSAQTLEYSTDTTTWTKMRTSTTISLPNIGDKVYIRGILSRASTVTSNYTQFKMSGKIAASGNCNALWNYEDLNTPLKTLCGLYMFAGCKSLTTAPELPATKLAPSCYKYMFRGCTGLTTAPELPATKLAGSCYSHMFYSCKSLTTAPVLPATTLAEYCYESMFEYCSSLTIAPELPATKLAKFCYYAMFRDCTSLNYIKCLATDVSDVADTCTNYWVENVSPIGTFVKHPGMSNWTRGVGGIPEGWTVVDAEV